MLEHEGVRRTAKEARRAGCLWPRGRWSVMLDSSNSRPSSPESGKGGKLKSLRANGSSGRLHLRKPMSLPNMMSFGYNRRGSKETNSVTLGLPKESIYPPSFTRDDLKPKGIDKLVIHPDSRVSSAPRKRF
eukprot:1147399-Prymnesium_polylepis.1